jgi:endonuclease/exonuclease/phosphatase family metal-dependent hydrolase
MDTGDSSTAVSRRSVLRAGLGTAAAGLLPGPVRADGRGDAATVATWNLGLGANLFSLFVVESRSELAATVGDLYDDVRESAPTARTRAAAAELAAAGPDVVAVQEAALVRTGRDDGGDPDAETVAFDFLADLTAALEEAGTPYEAAQVTTNADVEFPADVDGERIAVRLTDRDAILVREGGDVSVGRTATHGFDAALEFPLSDGRTLRVDRGYGVAETTVRGRDLTVVNTHLEAASEDVRGRQAEELTAALGDLPDRLVLLGDLNDGPSFGGGAYETLADPLTDAWDVARPDADGYTCCRPLSAGGEGTAALDERIDHVLYRGAVAATDAARLGASADATVTAEVDESERTLWPSDHAGVLATLGAATDAAATATASTRTIRTETRSTTESAATTPAATGSSTARTTTEAAATETEAPGFGPLTLVAGVLAGAAALAWRDDGGD